jgi:CHAT domain-containing protein/Tfp pilus assembly protein PilF
VPRAFKHRVWNLVLRLFLFLFALTSGPVPGRPQQSAPPTKIENFAETLVNKNSDAERGALLGRQTELATPELIEALATQGGRLVNRGQPQRALAIFEFARDIAGRIGDKAGTTRILNAIGNLHHRQGNFEESMQYHQQSLAISEALGDKRRAAISLLNIGNVHNSLGNYVRAMEYYRKSLVIKEAIEDKPGIAHALHNIGIIHYLQGNNEQALDHFQRSLAIYQVLKNSEMIARSLRALGASQTSQGNYEEALAYLEKSLAIEETLGNKSAIAIVLNNIGRAHAEQKNYKQALTYFEKSMALDEDRGNRDPGNRLTTAVLVNMARAHMDQGSYSQALDFAGHAAELSRQMGIRDTLWEAQLTAGNAYRALNQPAKAREAFQNAITGIEALRAQVAGGEQAQQRFFESKVSPYHGMIELLVAQSNLAEALTFAERAKARVLLDVLSSGRVNVTKAMTAQEQDQERKLNDQLVLLNTQIYSEDLRLQPDQTRLSELKMQLETARLQLEAFQMNLYSAHPELRFQRGEAPTLKLEEANLLLPDANTAVLEFVVAEKKIHLFVITKQSGTRIKAYPLAIEEKDLTSRVEGFRSMLAAADNRFSKSARELYDLLLKPAGEQLRGKSRLVIVPDGPLWELPIQALQTPSGRYLIDDHAIFYAPSLTVLREMIRTREREIKPAGAPALLALGNPALGNETVTRVKAVLMDENLEPLPDAERQVKTLGRIYGAENSKIYVGAEAREERFKSEARNFQILHLATHGVLNNRNPMYSHLLLAQTGGAVAEDGLLEARELMKLDLNADLAVLSACETARGRVGKGEGMIGLTWALFVAGAPTTVVSRWKVRSDSTAELMVEFHRKLKTGLDSKSAGASVSAALREAALKLKRDSRFRHPFHWAGFVVVGDGY